MYVIGDDKLMRQNKELKRRLHEACERYNALMAEHIKVVQDLYRMQHEIPTGRSQDIGI